jgi:hypothetical protein
MSKFTEPKNNMAGTIQGKYDICTIHVYFFRQHLVFTMTQEAQETDFKGPLLYVVQTDGSKKHIYLIIINPAYALQNSTL